MIVFEEEGFKQSFKIILNSRGIIIMTKGFMSSNYKEIYSRLYPEIRDIGVKNKFVSAEFTIDNVKLTFDSEEDAVAIKNIIMLGKTNTQALLDYIGTDTNQTDLEHIDYDNLEDDVALNRFNRVNNAPAAIEENVDASRVGMSPSDTLDYILSKRMQKISQQSQQPVQSPPVAAAPPASNSFAAPGITPPPVGLNCFSFYAFIDGKQQGPYDETQFKALVDYGLAKADTPVWKTGMPQWQSAISVMETAKFFMPPSPGTPPPPPAI